MKKLYFFTILSLILTFFTGAKIARAADPSLSLNPQFHTYYVGDIFTVDILLNTGGQDSDAADVILNYEPEYIELQDSIPSVPGTQVKPGTIYMAYPGNIVDPVAGKITLTAFSVMSPYNSGSGAGVFATMTFKALQVVDFTPVTFDFVPFGGDFYDDYVFGTSQDSNIAVTGSSADILKTVINGGYTIIPDEKPPYVTNFNPPNGAIDVPTNTNITFHIKDDETGVDLDTLFINVNGSIYTKNGPLQFTYSGNKYDYAITIDPPVNFDYETLVKVDIDAKDLSGNSMPTYHSEFTTGKPPVNQPPVLELISDKRIVAGETLYFLVKATDPNGDILAFDTLNLPAGAVLIYKANGLSLFSWTPQTEDIGTLSVDFIVKDNGTPILEDSQTVNIEVIPPPEEQPPVVCPPCPACGERTQCSDNRDNDGDGFSDYPMDLNCTDYFDNNELTMSNNLPHIAVNYYDRLKEYISDFAFDFSSFFKGKFKIATPDGNGFFILSPPTGTFYPGQKFSINILINTDNTNTNAADVVLSYDTTYLEVIDSLPATPGIQVKPGSVYEIYPGNIVTPSSGEIKITGFSVMGNYNSGVGTGVFATIEFKALAIVDATDVVFDFTPGSTTDTNIAEVGTGNDILAAVFDGKYKIIPDAKPPYITNFDPPNASTNRAISQDISFHIKDDETGVDLNTLKIRVNDTEYTKSSPGFGSSGGEKDYYITLSLPSFGYLETVNIYVDANDTSANTMSTYNSTFTTREMPLNHPPTLDSISEKSIYEDTDLGFILTGFDTDPSDSLTFTLENAPAGAKITNLKKGEAFFEWRPPAGSAGNYFVTFKISDNGDPVMFDEQIVTIVVKPYATTQTPQTICQQCVVCPQCSDNFDNDGDGLIDYPNDPGCDSPLDEDETDLKVTQCSDKIDNDGDGLIDYPNDPGCDSAADDDEIDVKVTQCSDKLDNDGDGLVDYPNDPGCDSAADDDEVDVLPKLTQCSDGVDNDGDGLADFPMDPGCDSAADDDESDLLPKEVKQIITGITDLTIDNPYIEKQAEGIGVPLLAAITLASLLSAISFADFLLFLQFLFTEPLRALIALKRRKWGIVYNAITKEPIDLAIVRLFRYQDNKLMQSRVTDKDGRYNFVVDQGKYYITVTKEEFVYPSKLLRRVTEDEKYIDIYHGEEISADEKDTLIILNIPLDPIKEFEKPAKLIFYHFFKKLQNLTSVSGLILAAVIFIIIPKWLTFGLFVLHVILFLIFRRLAAPTKPAGYGIIYDKKSRNPLSLAIARIFDLQYNKLMDSTVTDKNGRYSFLPGFGKYYVIGEKSGYKQGRSKDIDLSEMKEAIVSVDIGLERLAKQEKAIKTEQLVQQELNKIPEPSLLKKLGFQIGLLKIEKGKEELKEKIKYHIDKDGKLTPMVLDLPTQKEIPLTKEVKKLMDKKMGFGA